MTTFTNIEVYNQISRIFDIFEASEAVIRPHFILTGPSGCGKNHLIEFLCESRKMQTYEISAAQLTKEGTSGNSLSKALSPLQNHNGSPAVCFVDEFDKLFISGNTNSSLAHETTNGVQNEFLRVLESHKTSVYGDYGKYLDVPCDNILFVFAGAFNGEENIDIDRLRDFGIKTEFLGRVGLTYGMKKLSLADMAAILDDSALLSSYLDLFPDASRPHAVDQIMDALEEHHEQNTLGVRLINTLIHQYFINGGLQKKHVERTTFSKTLSIQ